jgi:thioester reductase-like protein
MNRLEMPQVSTQSVLRVDPLWLRQALRRRAERTPTDVVVEEGQLAINAEDLLKRAERLAESLRRLRVGPGHLVALYTKRTIERVVGLLGILNSGAAWLALDDHDPTPRIERLLRGIGPDLVVTQSDLTARLDDWTCPLIEVDGPSRSEAATGFLAEARFPADLARVTYTFEQGILGTRLGLRNHLRWLQQEFSLRAQSAVLHRTSLVSDVGVQEILWPILYGGKVVIAPDPCPAESLADLVVSRSIDVLHADSAELTSWMKTWSAGTIEALVSLRHLFCSGEPISRSMIERWLAIRESVMRARGGPDASRALITYLYNPAEVGTTAAAYRIAPESPVRERCLGEPTHVAVHVLDRHLQLVPFGVPGEICVVGEGLAQGYIGDLDRTARRFGSPPFAPRYSERLFRTGDIGRQRRDGSIELVAISEGTAWIGGWRVPLCEVEEILLQDPSVRDCLVRARRSECDGQRLVAYLVCEGRFPGDRLRALIESRLPGSLPRIAFVPIATMPRDASGRIDELALESLVVIDTALIERWEAAIRRDAAVAEAAVVVQEKREPLGRLHLADLLPPAREPAPAPTRPSQLRTSAPSMENSSGRPALSEAEPLQLASDEPVTLGDALYRAVRNTPGELVLHVHPEAAAHVQTYRELLSDAEKILAGLVRDGLRPGDIVLFQLEETKDFVPAFWACILGGLVPAPLPIPPTFRQPNAALSRLRQAWELLGRPMVLTQEEQAEALAELSGKVPSQPSRVLVLNQLRREPAGFVEHRGKGDDLAILILTSGSTGSAKAVMLSHRAVLSMCAGTVQRNGFTPQDVSLNWIGLDHVGALVPHVVMPVYLGCRQVHAPTRPVLEDPLRWLDWLSRYRVSIAWAPNFVYGLLNDRAERIAEGSWNLAALRFLINAGEPVVIATARRFLKILEPHRLPETAMHPAFGMSETCSGITWSDRFPPEVDTQFVELGSPIPGASLRIVNDQGTIVDEGVIGRLQIRGPSVMSGYYRAPELSRSTLLEGGWLETGDLGMLRDGRLTLTGREKDVIIINGVNYPNHAIEAAVEEVEGVEPSWTAACAVRTSNEEAEQLAIVFHPRGGEPEVDPPRALIQRIRERVTRTIGVDPSLILPLTREAIPKTAIGKIQRAQLGRAIQDGEFEAIQRRIDLALGGHRTLPDWFYRTVWRPCEGTKESWNRHQGRLLIVLDSTCLGEGLLRFESGSSDEPVVVEMAEDFERPTPTRFQIDAKVVGQYHRVFESLRADKIEIDRMVYLGGYEIPGRTTPDLGDTRSAFVLKALHLLELLRAIAQLDEAARPSRLLVVSSRSQATSAKDPVSPETALISGLMSSIAQEYRWLDCRNIDLGGVRIDQDAESLRAELAARPGEREVAYRQGRRLVPRLERVDWRAEETRELPVRQGGAYLITGGLGGIGRELAHWLMARFRVRLLLIGRSDITNRDAAGAERMRALRRLETLGTVVYEPLDVGDEDAMREVICRVERDWGTRLDGVFHLAGVPHDCAIQEETADSFETAIHAKVTGASVLDRITRERPGCLFVGFSSVNAVFGGSRAAAYSAANRYLELLTHEQRRRGRLVSWCLHWSQWEDVGMSRGSTYQELARSQGFEPISTEQGIQSLQAVLSRPGRSVLIGVDGTNPQLRFHVEAPVTETQQLVAYISTTCESSDLSRLRGLDIRDAYERRSHCRVLVLPELPRDETGQLDRPRLSMLTGSGTVMEAIESAPRTDVERQLIRLWQEVLQVPRVTIHNSFFELGGHSLLAAQLMARIASTMEVDLPLGVLFADPTVSGLARAVESHRRGETSAVTSIDLRAEAVLDPTIQPVSRIPADTSAQPNRILLTGATGFLGAFLLRDLLEHTDATIHCLVRAPSLGEGVNRIAANMQAYWLWNDSYPTRIVPVLGDLGQPRLNLDASDFQELAEQIDAIYHNGALVNFVYPYPLLKAANVEGTSELIRLACLERVKPIHFVSTLSVFPLVDLSGLGEALEEKSLEQPELLLDGYSQSKWVAERRLLEARARGLPVSIYRPARITGDSRTGMGEAEDLMWKLIGQCIRSGKTPAIEVQVDMTPVDYASRAIVALSAQSHWTGKTFHLANPSPISWRRLCDWIRQRGYPLEEVPVETWKDQVGAQVGSELQNSLFGWLPLVSALTSGDGPLVLPQLKHDCRNTLQGLEGTGIVCPPVDDAMLGTYFDRLQASRRLDPPRVAPS